MLPADSGAVFNFKDPNNVHSLSLAHIHTMRERKIPKISGAFFSPAIFLLFREDRKKISLESRDFSSFHTTSRRPPPALVND